MRRTSPSEDDEPRASSRHPSVQLNLVALTDPSHPQFPTEWDKFFEAYHPRLMSFFEYSVPDFDDRDELVQQTFIRGYRAIAVSGYPLKSAGAAWSWLTTIGKNLIRDGYDHAEATDRAMDSYKRSSTIDDELHQHAQDMLRRLAASDGYELGEWPVAPDVFALRVTQLSDDERLMLRLRFIEDLNWPEIAERLDVKAATVRKRFSRAAEFLRTGQSSHY